MRVPLACARFGRPPLEATQIDRHSLDTKVHMATVETEFSSNNTSESVR
jgi:hypothetical protein